MEEGNKRRKSENSPYFHAIKSIEIIQHSRGKILSRQQNYDGR